MWQVFGFSACTFSSNKPKCKSFNRGMHVVFTGHLRTYKSIIRVCFYGTACGMVVIPLQAQCGPKGSRRFRLPHFHDIWHVKVGRSSASRTGRLYPQECSWYSFSPGAELIPGPWCGQKEICQWNIQWHHRESIPGLWYGEIDPGIVVWWNVINFCVKKLTCYNFREHKPKFYSCKAD